MGLSAAAVAAEAAVPSEAVEDGQAAGDEDGKGAVAAAAVASVTNKEGHVNFFMDLEAGETTHTDNKAWSRLSFNFVFIFSGYIFIQRETPKTLKIEIQTAYCDSFCKP